MRKSFSSNKLTPINLPKQPLSDAFIDISVLDVMGIEEFLSVIKYRTENNQKDTWKEIYSLISHLKASRELMFIETHLFSSRSQEENSAESLQKIVDRLVDATKVIFDVERVNVFEIDTDSDEFVLTSSSEKQVLGIRFAIKDGIESELLSKCSIINSTAAAIDPKYLSVMDNQGKKALKNILCVPIIVESTIIGVLEAINKPIQIMNTPRDINTPKGVFYSSSEEKCLSFISSVVGSVLLRQCKSPSTNMKLLRLQNGPASSGGSVRSSASKKSTFNIHNRAAESSSKRSLGSDVSQSLQTLLDVTYQKLDAERVSIFAYDAFYQKLVCAVSLDIKGVRVPLDTGYVGQCYATSRVINITDAVQDPNHNKDIDNKIGFTSRSVLSVPILGADGIATGVVQAINKKNAVKFSEDDETILLELGKHFLNVLNNSNGAPVPESSALEGSSIVAAASIDSAAIASSAAATISRYIVDMLKCKSVNELFARAEHSVKSFVSSVECDMVAIYFSEKDMLVRAVVSDHMRSPKNAGKQQAYGFKGSMKMTELPLEIKEALQHNRITEFNAHNSTELNNLLPDVSIFQALIVPINATFRNSASFSGNCVIIYAKAASAGCVPFATTTKDLLISFSECFSCALQEIVERTAVEDNLKALQANLAKINNTLTNLQEVIIVLNREGNVVMCNKNLDDFFGQHSNLNRDSKAIGFQSFSEEGHYSLWLTADQCPQLYKDVGTTLQSSRLISREDVTIVNPQRQEELHVDYRIVAIEKTETGSPPSQSSISAILITIRKSKVEHQSVPNPRHAIDKNNPGVLVNPSIPLPSDLFQWEFNVLKYTEKPVLCNLMGKMFETLLNLSEIGINCTYLSNFIVEVGNTYNDLPFHNLQHSANVTHFTFMLIKATNALANLKPHMVFAILLSAMVHDVDHPGNTNLFEINSQSELALLYNDQAVLENHHCSVAFRLMRKENMQILSTMSKAHATEVRKFVIACILATDMSVHFDLVEEIKQKQTGGWNFTDGKDQLSLGKILVHAADLSNPVRPFHMSVAWARRISTEFNDQVAREQSLGLPVMAFMITKDDAAFCKNEIGFSTFVVAPMWRAIHHVFPDLHFLVDQMDSNAVEWKEWAERLKEEEKDATI